MGSRKSKVNPDTQAPGPLPAGSAVASAAAPEVEETAPDGGPASVSVSGLEPGQADRVVPLGNLRALAGFVEVPGVGVYSAGFLAGCKRPGCTNRDFVLAERMIFCNKCGPGPGVVGQAGELYGSINLDSGEMTIFAAPKPSKHWDGRLPVGTGVAVRPKVAVERPPGKSGRPAANQTTFLADEPADEPVNGQAD